MRFGFACLAAAVALFLLDTFVETHSLAGLSATVAMLLAFSALGVQTVWCIPVCMAFGAITVALNRLVRRARRNKRADLFTQQ